VVIQVGWLVLQPQSSYIAPYILQFPCQNDKMDLAFVFIESIYGVCGCRAKENKKMHPFGSWLGES